jgi:septal ring factor EnvC (AmiA/AmiB activator)
MTALEFILAAGGSGLVTALGAIGVNLYRARSANKVDETKVESDIHLSEADKATALSRQIAEDLRKDLAQMRTDMGTMLNAHLAVREENAALKAEVQSLRTENKALQEDVRALTAKVNELVLAAKK